VEFQTAGLAVKIVWLGILTLMSTRLVHMVVTAVMNCIDCKYRILVFLNFLCYSIMCLWLHNMFIDL
jgi:hypothetical protein